ncbi:sulfur carrier protein ThiS [Lutibaculum baratangense]|uniref:Sulfur carrier protein ThiS n=1 Tax=Lutibaculum baratangense AMV1 TaxID=631454 RepID=V4RQ25_9HYPH|nr:sulfur carrier protein ThiS [Lutibaculum baratangense]ESR25285.1 Sulfur carrier protein ThiS [Lutibaculum baratangense AMV1]
MRIIVNGERREVEGLALAEVLDELGYGGTVVATAVNERFVPQDGRQDLALSDGDRVEVLAPMQGG